MLTKLRRRRQAGQVLVLFALSFTVLTGLLVIAIDEGQLYLDRRQLQTAADAAALVGADVLQTLPTPTYTPAHQAAISAVVANLSGTSDPGTCAVSCSGTTIPSSGNLSIGNGYSLKLQVVTWDTYKVTVFHTHAYSLARALGFAASQTTAAQAKALSSTIPYALVLLKNDSLSYENLTMSGTPTGLILGGNTANGHGGAFSNESLNPGNGSITFPDCGTDGDLWAYSESVTGAAKVVLNTVGYEGASGFPTCLPPLAPYPKAASAQLAMPNYPEPPMSQQVSPAPVNQSTAISISNGKVEYLCPGNYTAAITVTNGGALVLMPGIYRFSGGGSLTGTGLITTSDNSAGAAPAAGWFPYPPSGWTASTNCASSPSGPPSDPGVIIEIAPGSACSTQLFGTSGSAGNIYLKPSPSYLNINIYVEMATSPWQTTCSSGPEGTHAVSFSGGSAYSIYGVLYGPGDNMSLGGNPAGWGVGQLICWTLVITGNGVAHENYNPAYLPYFRGLIQ